MMGIQGQRFSPSNGTINSFSSLLSRSPRKLVSKRLFLLLLLQQEKINQRTNDESVAPTSFLWSAYYPNRYYFEVRLFSWGFIGIAACSDNASSNRVKEEGLPQ